MELSRINLNLLLSLYHLLRTRSVTAAANAAHITQPAMSRNLSLLRDLLADPLLVRTGNQMQLTPRAESLWQQLPGLLNQLESLFVPDHFEPASYQGQFNIAATDFLTQQVFPPLLARFQQQAPGLQLHFHLWHPGMLDGLRQGRLDLAACIQEQLPDDIYGYEIGQDDYRCLFSPSHPLAAELAADQPMALEHYIQQPHIAVSGGGDKISAVDEALTLLGTQRRLQLTVPFIHSALAITARSHYLLTLPGLIAHQLQPQYGLYSCHLPAQLALSPLHYFLIWHTRLEHDPAHRWLRENCLTQLQQVQACRTAAPSQT
ncbi:MAG: LysR family transcriptional regulator [Marinobacterium sp.]|nr:LysR family transcriptional regulator [Marinobacterium sp.]